MNPPSRDLLEIKFEKNNFREIKKELSLTLYIFLVTKILYKNNTTNKTGKRKKENHTHLVTVRLGWKSSVIKTKHVSREKATTSLKDTLIKFIFFGLVLVLVSNENLERKPLTTVFIRPHKDLGVIRLSRTTIRKL